MNPFYDTAEDLINPLVDDSDISPMVRRSASQQFTLQLDQLPREFASEEKAARREIKLPSLRTVFIGAVMFATLGMLTGGVLNLLT